jgi:SOUL heme-binding protein
MQESPPKPSAGDVYIEESETITAYVASYGGWQTQDKITQHAAQLFEELGKKGVSVRHDVYYAASYDSPFRLMNRHNEVRRAAARARFWRCAQRRAGRCLRCGAALPRCRA